MSWYWLCVPTKMMEVLLGQGSSVVHPHTGDAAPAVTPSLQNNFGKTSPNTRKPSSTRDSRTFWAGAFRNTVRAQNDNIIRRVGDPKEENPEQRQGGDQPGGTDETMIHTVAGTVGSAIGAIASSAAKVVAGSNSADRDATEGEAKSKPHASSGGSGGPPTNVPKTGWAIGREKKAAHKRKLKRSNTKG